MFFYVFSSLPTNLVADGNCRSAFCSLDCLTLKLKMAPRRRRTTRLSKADHSPEPDSDTPAHVEAPELSHSGDDSCPACNADESPLNAAQKESWVRCDACKIWYHWVCAGNGGDLEAIDKWYGQRLLLSRPYSSRLTFVS